MALLKIHCPECNAGLKSPTGFKVGQTVCCPKCETYFAVEEPEDEDEAEEEPPKKGAAKGKPAPAKKPVKAAVAEDLPDEDEEEADEEEEETPKKKKKKKKKKRDDDEDDEERSYKNSPLRYAVLGILIIIMLVLAYLLYEKRTNEASDAGGPAPALAHRA